MTSRRAEREAWVLIRSLVLDRHSAQAEVVQAVGMSFGRIKTLNRIDVQGPMPLRDLVTVLGGDAPRTTVLVDDLVGRGLVERTVHPSDRRARIVAVTEEGRAVARKARAVLERPPAGFTRLADAELEALHAMLETIAAE